MQSAGAARHLYSGSRVFLYRHKDKYADIIAYTETICTEDPSIEADLTTATCNKFGVERTAELQAPRHNLGADSHRVQQLGDLMLYSCSYTCSPERRPIALSKRVLSAPAETSSFWDTANLNFSWSAAEMESRRSLLIPQLKFDAKKSWRALPL